MPFIVIPEPESNRHIISNNAGDIAIAIYHLEIEPLTRNADYGYLFGDDHGDLLAFEIREGIYETDLVTDAILWYAAEKLDYPAMEVQLTDPRPVIN